MATITRQEAEEFLYREARLLDEGKFEEWVTLFTPDAHYWLPTGEGRDPREESPMVYDDRGGLEDRISRLRDPAAHAQSPPSRMRHIISNVEVAKGTGETSIVYSNFVLYEVRVGLERSIAGHSEHHLQGDNGQWRIALKKVWLINRDLPIYNLTFLV